jgi:hypothetical protein
MNALLFSLRTAALIFAVSLPALAEMPMPTGAPAPTTTQTGTGSQTTMEMPSTQPLPAPPTTMPMPAPQPMPAPPPPPIAELWGQAGELQAQGLIYLAPGQTFSLAYRCQNSSAFSLYVSYSHIWDQPNLVGDPQLAANGAANGQWVLHNFTNTAGFSVGTLIRTQVVCVSSSGETAHANLDVLFVGLDTEPEY